MGKIKICIKNIKPQLRRRRDNKWTTKIHSSVNNINTKGKRLINTQYAVQSILVWSGDRLQVSFLLTTVE
jgi:hypothetical protein